MITVIDLEVNEEFELIQILKEEGCVVIHNNECGFCRQEISKIKFTNNQIN